MQTELEIEKCIGKRVVILFVLHASSLPENPHDGHTLHDIIDRTEILTGCERGLCRERISRPRHAKPTRRSSPPARSEASSASSKRELRCHPTIIGHMRTEGHLGRCFAKAAQAI
jgi:transposase, IS5 family